MEIANIQSFLRYYAKIRERTMKVARCIPEDKMDWTCAPGKFTNADILRHLAAIERFLYAENAQGKPNRYTGHGKELADGRDAVLQFMEQTHHESLEIFSRLTNADLQREFLTPSGIAMPIWKYLRAMTEHEIHHRGQLYVYLGILGVPTPPIFGLTSEEVAGKGKRSSL